MRGLIDRLSGASRGFDPELWTRVLRASLYLAGAQVTTDQVAAMTFADEATDIILEAMTKLRPIGSKLGVTYEYSIDLAAALSEQVMNNADALLIAFQKAAEEAAERKRSKETLQ